MPFADKQLDRVRINLCMAYLAYADELIPVDALDRVEAGKLALAAIERQMKQLPPCRAANGALDWRVVWGPASFTFPDGLLQDNAMFVAEQISQPGNLIVSIRGTNGAAILDWIADDLDVWTTVPWELPVGKTLGSPAAISRATSDALGILLHKLVPTPGQPGAGLALEAFLAQRTDTGLRISITGHSLAGALAPTLALWLEQRQGLAGGWDAEREARLAVVAFAGATPGNTAFAELFDARLGDACLRIHNELDIVPHAWDAAGMGSVLTLYASGGISPNLIERLLIAGIQRTVHGYAQIATSHPLRWDVQQAARGFLEQALLQHVRSYPTLLGVPQLLELPAFAGTSLFSRTPRQLLGLAAKTAAHVVAQALRAVLGARGRRPVGPSHGLPASQVERGNQTRIGGARAG